MTKKYNYKIFPTTLKARLLVAGAFVLGSLLLVGYAALFFLSLSGFTGFWSFGWFDKIEVTYENRTDTTIVIYINDRLEATVSPGEGRTIGYRKIEWWWHADLQARDLDGRLIFASRYDKDDLAELDYRVVIDE